MVPHTDWRDLLEKTKKIWFPVCFQYEDKYSSHQQQSLWISPFVGSLDKVKLPESLV